MRGLNLAYLKESIRFNPNILQRTVLRNMNRFTVVVSGKRAGKTTLCAYLALKELWLPYHITWVVGPNYDVASRVWDYAAEWIDKYFTNERGASPFNINRHDKIIENKLTGSKLFMKSAEETPTLLGKGLNLVIIDEAARIKDGIWDGYIRPNLADGGKGRAVLISNPFGFNWFYRLFLKGTEEGKVENPEYVSFQFSTAIEDREGNIKGSINPEAISIQELNSIKKSTPSDIWTSEYLGMFREGAGQLFRFEKCIDMSIPVEDPNEWFEPPRHGHLYSLGVDIAKLEDFTVICVIDRMDHRLIGFWRSNNRSWEYTREKIKEISQKYNDAEITCDTTGMGGDIFVENLAEIGVNVNTEFTYSSRSKMLLIDKLALFLERGQIKFPRLPALINELQEFTYNITPSGNYKYGSSRKDDCVNALALAAWNLGDMPLLDSIGETIYGMTKRNYS